ncbi:MAG: ABC transporter substrate-binding protein, partial [Propionicimonas sp.]|nr:ABC transporter substrate-binding protein [Propionicimonas sp.]
MHSHTLLRATAAAACVAMLAAGCSSGSPSPSASQPTADGSASQAPAEQITLTVATFNEFGYDNLLAKYTDTHPNVTVKEKKAATSNEARENFMTKIGAGSGLSDIEAVEVDWLTEIMQASDKLADLSSPDVQGRWLDWKAAQATTADGKLIGYGTDIGPEGVCYRSDLFAAAGLPTDRDEVAKLLGTWDDYFELGKKFVAKSDAAWFDSTDAIFQGMVNQVDNAFSSTAPEETIIPLDQNTAMRQMYDTVIKAAQDDDLSAHLAQWSTDWTAAFQVQAADAAKKPTFATMLCPGWMLGVIEGNAAGLEGWDIANAFPGGGGNWGGSFLVVPAQGPNVEAAK